MRTGEEGKEMGGKEREYEERGGERARRRKEDKWRKGKGDEGRGNGRRSKKEDRVGRGRKQEERGSWEGGKISERNRKIWCIMKAKNSRTAAKWVKSGRQ